MPQPLRNAAQQSAKAEVRARLRRFVLRVFPLLAGLHAYIGWRLLPAMPVGLVGDLVGAGLLSASALLIPAGMLARFVVPDRQLADRMTWVGAMVMGLFSSVLVLTLLRDLILLVVRSPSLAADSALAVPLAAVVASLIGLLSARRVASVVRVDIRLAGLPSALAGFTIAQISDIHIGQTIKVNYVRAIVERVNGLDADLIAITGDVVDGSVPDLSLDVAPLADLKARYGTYLVTGNHEYYSGVPEWVTEFRRLGLHPLLNEHVVIEHRGARLAVGGVTDYSAGFFDPAQRSDPVQAFAGAPAAVPRILLAHQPRSAHAAEGAGAGVDLQLSGHTHGGQFWPWNLFVWLQQPFTAGLHRLGSLWVYTSRGTGYWGPPNRFGAPSEISLIRLLPEGPTDEH